MTSRTWLAWSLACALSGTAAAQPAAPAATLPAPAATPPAPAGAAAVPASSPGRRSPPRAPAQKAAKIELGPVVAALNGGDADAAVQAASALGQSVDPAAHEALLDALAFGGPARLVVAVIGAVAVHPAPPDVQGLVRYATHRDVSVRTAALTALATYPAPAARQALLRGLRDTRPAVRAAAAEAAAKGRVREAVSPLLELLGKGEHTAARALGAMADVEIARTVGEQFGKVPDAMLAEALGLVLARPDFGPEPARVDLVRAIGKIQDPSAIGALTDYLDASPKNPPRESRIEAQKLVEARLGGKP